MRLRLAYWWLESEFEAAYRRGYVIEWRRRVNAVIFRWVTRANWRKYYGA